LLQHFEDERKERIDSGRPGSFYRQITGARDSTPNRGVMQAKLSRNRANGPFLCMEKPQDLRFAMGVEFHDGVSSCC
jgi:hypothetical protein